MVISYNKARASNNYAFYIVRYLPLDLSLSLLKYLAIIRPALDFLAKQLNLSHYTSSEFFFQDPCGKRRHLSSVQASSILRDLTRDLVTPWTLSLYRQAALAIAKRYLSKLIEKTNLYYPSDATHPIRMFAAGAGHHPRMLLTAYAIDKPYRPGYSRSFSRCTTNCLPLGRSGISSIIMKSVELRNQDHIFRRPPAIKGAKEQLALIT